MWILPPHLQSFVMCCSVWIEAFLQKCETTVCIICPHFGVKHLLGQSNSFQMQCPHAKRNWRSFYLLHLPYREETNPTVTLTS